MSVYTKKDIEQAFEAAVQKDNLCPVGKIIAESEHGDVIAAKVADQLHYSAAVISRVLKNLDFPVTSSETIQKHRKGACRCKA
jgi:hypothetical protein